ncbi:hypothetical protein BVX98_06480 [bacterium F11]|nr:hypothetical protein BVX98_06480 [bacterium F11]
MTIKSLFLGVTLFFNGIPHIPFPSLKNPLWIDFYQAINKNEKPTKVHPSPLPSQKSGAIQRQINLIRLIDSQA